MIIRTDPLTLLTRLVASDALQASALMSTASTTGFHRAANIDERKVEIVPEPGL